MFEWLIHHFEVGGHSMGTAAKPVTSFLDRGMLAAHQTVQSTVNIGKQTRATVNELDSLPAVVSRTVHSIEQPVMNLMGDADTAAKSVTHSSNSGQMVFQLMGIGALGWMGWNVFAYVAPKEHYRIAGELKRTAKRLKPNW